MSNISARPPLVINQLVIDSYNILFNWSDSFEKQDSKSYWHEMLKKLYCSSNTHKKTEETHSRYIKPLNF